MFLNAIITFWYFLWNLHLLGYWVLMCFLDVAVKILRVGYFDTTNGTYSTLGVPFTMLVSTRELGELFLTFTTFIQFRFFHFTLLFLRNRFLGHIMICIVYDIINNLLNDIPCCFIIKNFIEDNPLRITNFIYDFFWYFVWRFSCPSDSRVKILALTLLTTLPKIIKIK